MIADYEPDPYAEGAFEELFTEAEAKAFVAYLNRHPGVTTMERYDLPLPKNTAGFGANPVGGTVGNIGPFGVDDHGLPIEVFGYYDTKECEFDASLPDADPTSAARYIGVLGGDRLMLMAASSPGIGRPTNP